MDLSLKNKNILVVGASKGIGRSIALDFANEGSRVIALARSQSELLTLKSSMDVLNGLQNDFVVCDLMKENPNLIAEKLLIDYGVFDVVVHCVGGSLISRNPLGEVSEWMDAIKFNSGIAIDMNNKLIPPMINRGWGRIIHISSISAIMLRGNPLYASSKAFLNAYVKTVGREIAKTGVVMSAIMPGAISFKDSYWDKKIVDSPNIVQDFLTHHQAIGRFGKPDEISGLVLFLASDRASFFQGSILNIDGGNM